MAIRIGHASKDEWGKFTGGVAGAVEAAGVILRDTQAAARQAGTYVEEAAAAARDAAAQAESADYSAQDAAQAAIRLTLCISLWRIWWDCLWR